MPPTVARRCRASSRSAAATGWPRRCRRCAGWSNELTAVVTVADNGGSSGRLRAEFGCLPPGDLRQALSALCERRRLGAAPGRGCSSTGSPAPARWTGTRSATSSSSRSGSCSGTTSSGLDWVGRLLGAGGRVLPMALVPLDITAGRRGRGPGDRRWRTTCPRPGRGRLDRRVGSSRSRSSPAEPPACPEARRGRRRGRLGRARPRLVVHQRHPAPARARAARRGGARHRPPSWSCSTSRPSRGRPTGSLPRPTSRCSPTTRRSCGSTACSPTSRRSGTSTRSRRAAERLGARLCSPTSPSATARHGTTPASWRPPFRPFSGGRRVTQRWTWGPGPARRETSEWQDRTYGDDGTGEGGAGQHAGDQDLLPQGGGLLDAPVRRGAPHRQRADRGRGRARHRSRRPPAAPRHRRGLRPRLRRRHGAGPRHPQEQPLRRPRRQGRRGAGPPDRAARRPRPSGARAAAAGRLRRQLRRGRRLARAPSWPTARSPSRAAPPRSRSPAPGRRPRSRSSAPPAGSASAPRPARCAASTASSSATATRSARC